MCMSMPDATLVTNGIHLAATCRICQAPTLRPVAVRLGVAIVEQLCRGY